MLRLLLDTYIISLLVIHICLRMVLENRLVHKLNNIPTEEGPIPRTLPMCRHNVLWDTIANPNRDPYHSEIKQDELLDGIVEAQALGRVLSVVIAYGDSLAESIPSSHSAGILPEYQKIQNWLLLHHKQNIAAGNITASLIEQFEHQTNALLEALTNLNACAGYRAQDKKV